MNYPFSPPPRDTQRESFSLVHRDTQPLFWFGLFGYLVPCYSADVTISLLQGEDGGEGEDLDTLVARVVMNIQRRIAEDDTKQRLTLEPKDGDIKVTGQLAAWGCARGCQVRRSEVM